MTDIVTPLFTPATPPSMVLTPAPVEPVLDMTPAQYAMADSTGKILYYGRGPKYIVDIQVPPDGCTLVESTTADDEIDVDKDYVASGAIVSRPVNSATLSGLVLSNLPNPCTINVNGADHACTDPTCTLSFSQPGTYPVTVSAWPMLDATFQVTQS